MAKKILIDCADKVDTVVTVPTTAITPDNAKALMGN
jgi:ribose transport system substrate-binding protein